MTVQPTLLAFDTSAAYCAAALLLRGQIITRVDEMKKGQAEHLMPMLNEMLSEAGLGWQDLDGIGVGLGPGNFTGIRISVAAARGIALALGKPAIGVNGFEARAHGFARPIVATIPAPRENHYVQTFADSGPDEPRLEPLSDFAPTCPVVPEADAQTLIRNVALIAASRLGTPLPRPAPLYVRAADAAPPRDPAPVILS